VPGEEDPAQRKLERWHKSLNSKCVRPATPLMPEDGRRLIQQHVDHYNTVRLHSAIGFITPADMLAGRQAEIHAAREPGRRAWPPLIVLRICLRTTMSFSRPGRSLGSNGD
jgi:hypothetical protein